MQIAVVGIDGSGKTTLIRQSVRLLGNHNFKVGYIDLPYFSDVPGFKSVSRIITKILRWAEADKHKTVVVLIAILSAILYILAQRKMRKNDFLFVEHHPLIDISAYAELYAGYIGLFLANSVMCFWSKPNVIVMISVPAEICYERILKRGKGPQIHETVSQLRYLESLLSASVKRALKSEDKCLLKDITPEKLVHWLKSNLKIQE
ncbi:AAA family ATPase [Patescibacteria group bacterium]|nr:AAA family ATPase [Patescibacteria group bacterium]